MYICIIMSFEIQSTIQLTDIIVANIAELYEITKLYQGQFGYGTVRQSTCEQFLGFWLHLHDDSTALVVPSQHELHRFIWLQDLQQVWCDATKVKRYLMRYGKLIDYELPVVTDFMA